MSKTHVIFQVPAKAPDAARLDELIEKPMLAPHERSELRWLIVALRRELHDLREYKAMYEGLCK